MGSTALLGRCTIGSVFKIADINETDSFYRVQGVALPSEIVVNHYVFSILEDRIREMVIIVCVKEMISVNFDDIIFYRIQLVCRQKQLINLNIHMKN